MKRQSAGILAAFSILGLAPAARAAAPSEFRARGTFHSEAGGDSQNMGIVISFKTGHVRIESNSAEAGKSVILATRGEDDITMLDPAEKIVVHMRPSMLKGAAGTDGS
ncbi:MAG: hypothetical protein KGR26_10440, partial [Cyanobacteria bacterium REEB65]|nr:hypothetical protein [Cyanobacteria bacterium REEB65]